ncbi:MAG: YbaK/EbsC family protein [Candidatus Dormibacteraceae bacterium]
MSRLVLEEHSIGQQIVKLLRENDCWFETFEHEPVRTSEEAAQIRDGYSLRQGAKALIIRAAIAGQGKKFLMLVVPGDRRFDEDKVKLLLNAKNIRFATEEEVESITEGVKPGGVPPFGNLFNLEVISDSSLYDMEKIVFNAGRTFSIAVKPADYQRLVEPQVAGIV